MGGFLFWQRWLMSVSVFAVLVGLVIAFFPDSGIFAAHTATIAEVYFQGVIPEEATRLRAFLFAPLGGTIAGYFLLQSFVVWYSFRERQRWAWHAVCWPLLLWFTVDSGLSVYHGAVFNVWMVNIWTLVLVGVPLVMTYGDFHEAASEPYS